MTTTAKSIIGGTETSQPKAILCEDKKVDEVLDLTPRQRMWIRAKKHRGLQFGAFVVLFMVLAAVLAPWLAPHDPFVQDLSQRLIPPVWTEGGSWSHIFGTDHLGRDYLSRLMYGAQVSLGVGFGAAALGCVLGVTMGMLSGYYGGRIAHGTSFLLTCQLSLPNLLMAMSIVFFVGTSIPTLIIVLGCLHWTYFMAVSRTVTRQIVEMEYVSAARSIGSSDRQILLHEILPNIVNQIIVVFSLEIAVLIIAEASLSFLGVGVQPPTASWGLMIAEGKSFMFFKPYLVIIPGAALFLLVLAVNMFGDGIRDVTAPEHRN
ncbi:ABC transporter permease [uncultured Oceanisphaera sp.]|uniref:ABC transporter permease n=1 Tax=uncultured Oceanisphaera sp. TaxID=353858 RepID=UPI0026147F4A|nr:ABC transporter permease [uncultured Oceanisphaera sp.]